MEKYKEYAELDKEELISKVIYLEDKEEEELEEELREMEDEIADCEYLQKYEDGVWVNIDNFIERLKLENLYTDVIENFIEDYLKFYND